MTQCLSVLAPLCMALTLICSPVLAAPRGALTGKDSQTITIGTISKGAQVTIQQIQGVDPQMVQSLLLLQQKLDEKNRQYEKVKNELYAATLRLADEARRKPDDAKVQAARRAYLAGDTEKAELLFRTYEGELVAEGHDRLLDNLAKAATIARERAAMASVRDTSAAVAAWSMVVEYEASEATNWWSYGDILVKAGNLVEATKAFLRFNKLAEEDAIRKPDDLDALDELSISFNKLGEMQWMQGNLSAALENYKKSFEICKKFVADNPWAHYLKYDLAASLQRIGDIQLAQGHLTLALDSYQKSLVISQEVYAFEPSWDRQIVLAIAHEKIGDIEVALGHRHEALDNYQQSAEIAEAILLQIFSNNATNFTEESNFHLTFIYAKIGDIYLKNRDPVKALERFRKSLVITNELVTNNPSNSLWQRDLMISFCKIGEALEAQGNPSGALENFQKGLAIAEQLTARDSTNVIWQHDLSVVMKDIAKVQKK